jgi:gliding-associated putative ABC transporter substrate-binding component GldG
MAQTTSNKRKRQQQQAILRIMMIAVILVGINMLASRFHKSFDLTKEKRFTLSDATKKMLLNLDDMVVVDVFLEGKFPAGFQRLSETTRERLQAFKEYGGKKIVFHFSDPFEGATEADKEKIVQALYDKGVEPLNLNVKGERNSSSQVVFPYALVQYHGHTQAVKLLENHLGMSPLEVLNYSESLLEYKLASAIHHLQSPYKPTVAYVVGNGEPLGVNTKDLLTTLNKYYKVDTVDLNDGYHINAALYKAVIICKPTLPFSEPAKYKIDQYVMHGGKILWAVEALNTPVDSLQKSSQFITSEYGLNLDDILFKYGVRINTDLVEDVNCAGVPLITGTLNDGQPQIELRPWTFLPILIPDSKHPIVNNMDAVISKFANSIDTIDNKTIQKSILLQSSSYSRNAYNPVRVNLSMLKYDPDPKLFNKPYKNIAVLLEGQFSSVYQNRMAPEFLSLMNDSLHYPFKSTTDTSSSMIVISDGDMLLNTFSQERGVEELGYWTYTQSLFANKNFILNCMEYLTDPYSLLEARSKDIKLRLLDMKRAKEEERKWQLVNIGVPVLLVLLFSSAFMFFRKRRYENAE